MVDMQDQNVNPKVQDHVTFRTCINPRAVKAAEKVGGAAAQYAGPLYCLSNVPASRVAMPRQVCHTTRFLCAVPSCRITCDG